MGFFKRHKLDISQKKSKILSYNAATDQISFDFAGFQSVCLDQVLVFKYLGIPINCTPYNFFKSFNDQVRKKAKAYLYSVLSLVRSGPDRADLAYSLWVASLSCAELGPSLFYSFYTHNFLCLIISYKFFYNEQGYSLDFSCTSRHLSNFSNVVWFCLLTLKNKYK